MEKLRKLASYAIASLVVGVGLATIGYGYVIGLSLFGITPLA